MSEDFWKKINEDYKEPITKDNHIIPQFLLRNFCKQNTNESLYINTITNEKSNPIIRKDKAQFPGMFSGKLIFNNELEQFLGKEEDRAAPIIHKIHEHSKKYLKHSKYSIFLSSTKIQSEVDFFDTLDIELSENDLLHVSKLYTSILVRLNMVKTQSSFAKIFKNETFLNEYCEDILNIFSLEYPENSYSFIEQLNNFKTKLLSAHEIKLLMDLNEDYYKSSQAKQLVYTFIHKCFAEKRVILVKWDAPIVTISNYFPFSWKDRNMILPISANSFLYLDEKIDPKDYLCISHIKNNTVELLRQYKTSILNAGTEFLYYDKTIAEYRHDYNLLNFISANNRKKKL